jgi:hypothetical protein
MIRKIPISVAAAGSLAILALLVLLHDILLPPAAPVFPPPAPAAISARQSTPPVPSLDPQNYLTIDARPVFASSRRPPPPGAAAPAAGPPPVTFSLVGVIDAPDEKFALVVDSGNQTAIKLSQGGSIDGWTVARIDHSSILVQSGSTFETIKIVQ